MANTSALIYLFSVFIFTKAAILPSYLPPCTESDPEFDACAKASIKAALPHIANGDPEFHIPKISPLEIPEVVLSSKELNIEFQNIQVFGLTDIKEIDEFHWDKVTNIVTGQITVPKVHITSDYKIDGRILVLPINGKGKFDLKLDNVVVQAEYPIELVAQEDGSRKLQVGTGKLSYTTTKASFDLDNLFGDKQLSANMNQLLNENWENVLKDLGETVPITLEAIIKSIAKGIFSKISV